MFTQDNIAQASASAAAIYTSSVQITPHSIRGNFPIASPANHPSGTQLLHRNSNIPHYQEEDPDMIFQAANRPQ